MRSGHFFPPRACNVADGLASPALGSLARSLSSQSFMSGLFRKKGRGVDRKLLSRRDIIFGECVRAGGFVSRAAGPSARRAGRRFGLCVVSLSRRFLQIWRVKAAT